MNVSDVPQKLNRNEKNCLVHLCKKVITRKCVKVEAPTIEEWVTIVHEVYIIEEITCFVWVQKDQFYRICSKRSDYVTYVRSD